MWKIKNLKNLKYLKETFFATDFLTFWLTIGHLNVYQWKPIFLFPYQKPVWEKKPTSFCFAVWLLETFFFLSCHPPFLSSLVFCIDEVSKYWRKKCHLVFFSFSFLEQNQVLKNMFKKLFGQQWLFGSRMLLCIE